MRRRSIRSAPRARGFTLLEAIVALALIASTGLALMAWINTNLLAASRLQQRDAEAQVKLTATQAIQTINPLLRPEGELRLGQLTVRWRSEAATAATVSAGFAGAGQFTVQLFETRVDARDEGSGAEVQFTATLLGYRPLAGGARGQI